VSAVQARLSIGRRWPRLYEAWRAWERVRADFAKIDVAARPTRPRLAGACAGAGDGDPDPSPRRPAA